MLLSKTDAQKALRVLSRAQAILSQSYTDRGYKFISKLKDKKLQVCALGAVDEAYRQLHMKKPINDDPTLDLLQFVALRIYDRSFVTVNDDLGFKHIMNVFANAIEECVKYAITQNPRYITDDTGRF